MFAIPALGVLLPLESSKELRNFAFLTVSALFILLIGLRFEVGADWGNYIRYYDAYYGAKFSSISLAGDPGFLVLNWFSGKLGGGVYFVNIVCSALFMSAVIHFCRRQAVPWLAMLIAVPYLIIVVSMGYVRQGVAIGFELLALSALVDSRLRAFLFYVFCGLLFHKSAILILPFALLAQKVSRTVAILLFSFLSIILVLLLLSNSYQVLWAYYTSAALSSEGGAIRVWMNVPPAIILLLCRKKLTKEGIERRLWFWFAVISLFCVPLVGIASTAVDRVALFLIPIQIFLLSRLHCLFSDKFLRTLAVVAVVLSYATIQFVWLNFANQSSSWAPYQFAPFTAL